MAALADIIRLCCSSYAKIAAIHFDRQISQQE
jgi:hypothetical protein